jgi:hypothetical protein
MILEKQTSQNIYGFYLFCGLAGRPPPVTSRKSGPLCDIKLNFLLLLILRQTLENYSFYKLCPLYSKLRESWSRSEFVGSVTTGNLTVAV